MGFTPCKKKKHKKIKAYRKSVKKEPTVKRCLLILEMKPYIIVQRKAFYRQRIPESSCANKETVDTDILATSGPFRRFSTRVWQNAHANTVRRAIVCDFYFPFSKTL